MFSQQTNKDYCQFKLENDFFSTNQGGESNIDYSLAFQDTINAFNQLGIDSNEQNVIFKIIASILNLLIQIMKVMWLKVLSIL